MVRKGLYIVLMISLVFGVGFFSGCRPHGHHRGVEFAVDYVTEVLDLTEAQQEHLNQIKDELMAKREPFNNHIPEYFIIIYRSFILVNNAQAKGDRSCNMCFNILYRR